MYTFDLNVIERALQHANDEIRYAISLAVVDGNQNATKTLREVQDKVIEALDLLPF